NMLENLNGSIRRVTRNVKRWRGYDMRRRWVGLAISEASKCFHRIKGYGDLPILITLNAQLAAAVARRRTSAHSTSTVIGLAAGRAVLAWPGTDAGPHVGRRSSVTSRVRPAMSTTDARRARPSREARPLAGGLRRRFRCEPGDGA